jgi:PIN domain nuclease of toxin-antitoxin system
VRLLLDTHVAIWAITAPDELKRPIREIIASAANSIHVSSVSVWEIAIKFALAKKSAPPFSGHDAVRYFRQAGYALVDVIPEHAAAVGDLPHLHGDPFDRLIIAQALAFPLRLITHDDSVASYSDTIILA